MNFFTDLVQNKVLLSAVSGWLIAQILKTLIHLFFTKKFVAERLVGSGGMPSSHSATVCALATSTCIYYGAQSFEFAIATILAIIVMYDAMGVRRETGIQAKVLNEMIQLFTDMGSEMTAPMNQERIPFHAPVCVIVTAASDVADEL